MSCARPFAAVVRPWTVYCPLQENALIVRRSCGAAACSAVLNSPSELAQLTFRAHVPCTRVTMASGGNVASEIPHSVFLMVVSWAEELHSASAQPSMPRSMLSVSIKSAKRSSYSDGSLPRKGRSRWSRRDAGGAREGRLRRPVPPSQFGTVKVDQQRGALSVSFLPQTRHRKTHDILRLIVRCRHAQPCELQHASCGETPRSVENRLWNEDGRLHHGLDP